MPDAGAYSYLKRLLAGRPIPFHPAHLRLAAAAATIALILAVAAVLWIAPWPIDAITAVAGAVAWTSWLDHQERA